MKIQLFFLLISLQVSARGIAQNVSLNEKNVSVATVLEKITHQTGAYFWYDNSIISNKNVSIYCKNLPLEKALETICTNQNFIYEKINGKIYTFKKKEIFKFNVSPIIATENLPPLPPPPVIIRGKVTDDKGKPLAGASIIIKGKGGAQTNENGDFEITVPDNVTVLQVSYVGYENAEVNIKGKTYVTVSLKEVPTITQEVVVVGYGTQKKATLTGSVETISSKTFQDRAVTNIGLALQGETPGLVVTRNSPRPGNEGLAFTIRGLTSINGGSPLIVIDGVPALNTYSFQNMNSDDVESISVLKDGAASIYGSRAANGVILVTTKKGKGKTKIDYNGNFRFTTDGITGYSPSMQQYATMWIEANKEESVPNWWGWVSLGNMQKMQQGIAGIYPTAYWGNIFLGNANRISEMFAQRFSYQHNISISNKGENSAYRLSLGYANNKGNLATAYDGQKQYNIRFNYDYQISKKLKVESGVSMVDAVTSGPAVGLDNSLFAYDMPIFPAKNPYGEWYANFGSAGNRNAAAATSDGGRDNVNDMTIRLDLKATYQIYKDLAFEGMASFQNERANRERYLIPVQTYDWFGNRAAILASTQQNSIDPSTVSVTASNGGPGYYSFAGNYFYQYYSAMLKYNKTIKGLHNISAAAGINAEKKYSQFLTGIRQTFTDLGVYDLNTASATGAIANSGGKDINGLYSYIARINYNYAEKYLVEVLGRIDGNSKFASGYQFKNFASASLGWVFTKENFFKAFTNVLNFGKLRASYGSAGNDVGLGSFDYLSTIATGTLAMGVPAALQNVSALSNSGLISTTRTWEKVEQKNIAIDLAFLNNRLTGTFEYFIKDNTGMLSNVNYPSVLGGSAPKTNSGHFNTKGWETVVSWKDTKKDFSYNVSFNISNTKTLVTNVQGYDNWVAGKNAIINGRPYNSWFVYKTAGYFKDQADVDAYYAKYGSSTDLANMPASGAAANLRPGDTKKVDVAGTGNITSAGNAKSSLVFVGDNNPHYTFGFNFGASWKNFDINAFFQGQFKKLIQRTSWMAYPFVAQWTNQNPSFLGKTWTTTHTNATFPRLTVNNIRSAWDYVNNDFMIQNDKYIRLKSLIIGYTLPQKWTQRAKINKIRVYFSGNDLWEWVHIKDGYDPEMGENSVDGNGYPFYRTWSFGINMGL